MMSQNERFIGDVTPIISRSDIDSRFIQDGGSMIAKSVIDESCDYDVFSNRIFCSSIYLDDLYLAVAHDLTYDKCQALLQKELVTSPLYAKVWGIARKNILHKDKVRPLTLNIPFECHLAVVAYTLPEVLIQGKQRKFYEEFNASCRELTIFNWELFPFKSFFGFLKKAIHGIVSSPKINPNQHVYRGIRKFHYGENDLKINEPISFNQFMSCSTDPYIAKMFEGGYGTIIEFTSTPEAAMGITNYSDFDENEILIFPWNKFTVRKIVRKGPTHLIVVDIDEVSFPSSWRICMKCGATHLTEQDKYVVKKIKEMKIVEEKAKGKP